MQIIHQFASNLAPLLKCLKLTLIYCEDVPLITNSLNSHPQIALAQAWQDPWWCNRTQLLYEYTYCVQEKSYLSLRTPSKQTRKCALEVVLRLSHLFTPSRSGQSDMNIDDRDPIHCICPKANGNQCREEKQISLTKCVAIENNQSMNTHTHVHTKAVLCKMILANMRVLSKKDTCDSRRFLLLSLDKHRKQSLNKCSSLLSQ